MELPEVTPSRLGGDVAVDFFNTVDWRLDPARRHERLASYLHLLAWVMQVGLISPDVAQALAERSTRSAPDASERELADVIALRDHTYDVLTADAALAVLERELSAAHAASTLYRGSAAWEWSPRGLELSTPRHLIALEFGRLVTSEHVMLLRRCADQHCGWVFLDTSRQRNRRWCSAADCGNRNRVRAHYARSRFGA
ncbi:MAG: CGNR zinc finger domain-containing protein [Microbacterium sp.]